MINRLWRLAARWLPAALVVHLPDYAPMAAFILVWCARYTQPDALPDMMLRLGSPLVLAGFERAGGVVPAFRLVLGRRFYDATLFPAAPAVYGDAPAAQALRPLIGLGTMTGVLPNHLAK